MAGDHDLIKMHFDKDELLFDYVSNVVKFKTTVKVVTEQRK